MQTHKTLLALAVALLLAGCGKQENDSAAEPVEPPPAPAAEPEAEPVAAAEAAPIATTGTTQPRAVTQFDITALPLSDAALPAWPYVALPAGYRYYNGADLVPRSKDLARVPVWTGGQLLWVEGRSFSDWVSTDDGKTFSKFELRRNMQQAIEAVGGVRLGERSYDADTFEANRKALEDFRQEFSAMQGAYQYDADVDTYVIRRADKAIWLVLQARNDDGALLVVDGPLPQAGVATE